MEKDLLTWLVQQAPVVVVLGIAIYVLYRKTESKDAEIKELNIYIREKTLEMLVTLRDVSVVLEKVTDSHTEVKDTVKEMRSTILERINKLELDSLKNGSSKSKG